MPDPHAGTTNAGTPPRLHKDVYPAISPQTLASSMQGRIVFVTGAGRGIGRAIALSFAKAGASGLAILSRTVGELESLAAEVASKYPETRSLVCVADVSDRTAVEATVKKIENDFGRIDVLVANAGVNLFRPFAYTPGEDWWRIVEINLKGPMMLTEMVLPGMRARNEGSIIYVVSRAGILSIPGASSYTVSKAALIRACAVLQVELDTEAGGESGIHTYSLHPGGVKTELTLSSLHPDVDKMQPGFCDRIRNVYENVMDQTPELCGQTCVYLAAGRATALRGRYLDVGDDIEDIARQADTVRKMNMYDLGVKILGGQMAEGLRREP
ncbi:NAD-binding protein [Fomitiporia mediterranea MF3/22]|uniref:NAD-binding protein n=1 Tax=Fomitiporia mediterranea (strain MF3/22) TaxID=694068 RepID=UPI00044072A4|nr:NAD-binding protein [Fomitiporia mediterranea MF3/22]EJD04552.1 NAD-binding protein [Fomitiporia mediterranea MF3/22]